MTRLASRLGYAVLLLLLFVSTGRAGNLIVNGDFSSGYTGYTTGYVLPPTDIVGGAGQYLLVDNPANYHPSGASYGTPTGSGLMMMLNGAADPTTVVWSETINVSTDSDYDFSLYLSSWTASSPATLEIDFNGTSIGTPTAPSTTAVWHQFSTTWNSGDTTSLTITIYDTNTADLGNDFALDDISLTGPSPVPEPSSFVLALIGVGSMLSLGWLRRKRISGGSY